MQLKSNIMKYRPHRRQIHLMCNTILAIAHYVVDTSVITVGIGIIVIVILAAALMLGRR